MYKPNDIVLVKSPAGPAIPPIHVKLLKQVVVKPSKYTKGFTGWEAKLVYEKEANMLRKNWSIPFKFPDKIDTFVYETNIIKKVRRRKNRYKQRS
jgi:hypothetical protein